MPDRTLPPQVDHAPEADGGAVPPRQLDVRLVGLRDSRPGDGLPAVRTRRTRSSGGEASLLPTVWQELNALQGRSPGVARIPRTVRCHQGSEFSTFQLKCMRL